MARWLAQATANPMPGITSDVKLCQPGDQRRSVTLVPGLLTAAVGHALNLLEFGHV